MDKPDTDKTARQTKLLLTTVESYIKSRYMGDHSTHTDAQQLEMDDLIEIQADLTKRVYTPKDTGLAPAPPKPTQPIVVPEPEPPTAPAPAPKYSPRNR